MAGRFPLPNPGVMPANFYQQVAITHTATLPSSRFQENASRYAALLTSHRNLSEKFKAFGLDDGSSETHLNGLLTKMKKELAHQRYVEVGQMVPKPQVDLVDSTMEPLLGDFFINNPPPKMFEYFYLAKLCRCTTAALVLWFQVQYAILATIP